MIRLPAGMGIRSTEELHTLSRVKFGGGGGNGDLRVLCSKVNCEPRNCLGISGKMDEQQSPRGLTAPLWCRISHVSAGE